MNKVDALIKKYKSYRSISFMYLMDKQEFARACSCFAYHIGRYNKFDAIEFLRIVNTPVYKKYIHSFIFARARSVCIYIRLDYSNGGFSKLITQEKITKELINNMLIKQLRQSRIAPDKISISGNTIKCWWD